MSEPVKEVDASPVPSPSTPDALNVSGATDNEDARSVAGSEKSTSSRSGIPKFAGSRLPTQSAGAAPGGGATSGMTSAHGASNSSLASASSVSRIGRPCTGHTKPPLPTLTPPSKNLSSYDYVRRVSDDLNRYKLSDLIEMDEFEEDFFGNRLHNFSSFSSTLPKTYKTLSAFDRAYDTFKSYRSPFENSPDLFKDDPFKDYASSYSSYSSYSKPPKGLSRERSTSRERSRERSPSLRRTSLGSTGTASSMDALWDLHPRRLSEAGLSRYSDNSAVLTEDTNSFIIGQRVFVGGTKPGQIAYIGETQFAPGEWAGIVLDQPIGKNDGSVGGIRYFQCEAKRGVFSRLGRLTRYPLGSDVSAGGDSSYGAASPSPTNGMRKTQISPTTSTRSALSISNSSLASAHVDFKLGDRVIIKSSQGSKVGTLRYMGFTSFANGEWCGVELDEPRGKNDGSVAGERYFDCRPNYGLFAPVSKVSRSPSNRRPSNCVVHSTSMRRSNSKESLLSMTSSLASATAPTQAARRVRLGVTSLTPKKSATPPKTTSTPLPSRTALQDVLKEKQQHIEHLLKERDLERVEFTKAASLADEAEQKYVSLQKEFENYRLDSDQTFKEYVAKLTQSEVDKKDLLGQLDEERGKNEDWQFKFEEAAITRADAESTNEEHVAKIAEMEVQMSQFRAENEVNTTNLSQANENINQLKELIEAMKVELEHANEKRTSLESEETKSIELVQNLQSKLEEANTTLKQQQEMSHKQMDDLNKQLTRMKSEHEVDSFKQNQEIEELRAKYTTDINVKNDELKVLAVNLEETKSQFENYKKELDKLKFDSEGVEQNLRKDLDKLKMDISGKVLELENLHESNKTQSGDIKKLEEELAQTQKALETQIRETESVNMEEEKSMIEVEKLKKLLQESKEQTEKLRVEMEQKIEEERKEIDDSNLKINEMSQVMNLLKAEIASKVEETKDLQSKYQRTEEELAKTCQKLEKEKTEHGEVQNKLTTELQHLDEVKVKDSQLGLQLGDSQRTVQQLEEKLAEAAIVKTKLAAEIEQLLGASGEESSKLEILNKELRDKQAEFEINKTQHESKVKELEHSLQEVRINLVNIEEKSKLEKEDFEKSNLMLKQQIAELCESSGKSQESLNKTLVDLRNELKNIKQEVVEKEGAIDQLKNELTQEQHSKTSLEQNVSENVKTMHEMQAKFEEAVKQIATLKEEVILTEDKFNLANKDLQTRASENEDAVSNLKEVHDEQVRTLEATILEKDATVKELLANIEEIEKQNSQKDANATEKDLELQALKDTHFDVKKHSEELRLDCENNKQQLLNSQTEITKLNEKLHELGVKISEKEHELQEAHKGEAVILEKNNKITSLEYNLMEVNKTVESLSAQLDAGKVKEVKLQSDLEVKIKEFENLQSEVMSKAEVSNDVQQQLKVKNDEVIKLQSEVKSVNDEKHKSDVVITELREKLGKMVDSQTHAKQEMDVLTQKVHNLSVSQGLFKLLRVTEEHKQQLLKSKAIMEVEALQEIVTNLPVQIINDNKEKVMHLEQMINTNNETLQKANEKVRQQQNDIILLQQELLKVKMEADKKITTVRVSDEAINNNNSKSNTNDYKQLLEEKLEAETQVEFLHAIIADMQKKNDDQKARIEILESGYSPAAADELKLIGIIDKTVTPRMYCDICEEFDLHETEDCPTQADDDMPPPPPPDGKKKEPKPPRPYCEICEAFGHDTDDCTEDETY